MQRQRCHPSLRQPKPDTLQSVGFKLLPSLLVKTCPPAHSVDEEWINEILNGILTFMKKKNIKKWIVLLVFPVPSLLLVMLLQIASRILFGQGPLEIVINIVSLLVGISAVLALLGLPIWIVMLILAHNHNQRVDAAIQAQPQPLYGSPGSQQPPPQQQ